MKIHIIAVGKNMPNWVQTGFYEYANRMPSDYQVKLTEVHAEKRTKNSDIQKIIAIEEAKILAVLPKNAIVIMLERAGKSFDTKTLAKRLETWHDDHQAICFVIGGPEGLSDAFLKKSHEVWSLSQLTLPHPLVRVVLAEQIYRAWSIIVNHPYHR